MSLDPFSGPFTALAVLTPSEREIRRSEPRLRLSRLTSTETRLPEGIRPASLPGVETGALVDGSFPWVPRGFVERTVDASLRHIQQVAAALPIDAEDERIVDALVARRIGTPASRPLRRRVNDRS